MLPALAHPSDPPKQLKIAVENVSNKQYHKWISHFQRNYLKKYFLNNPTHNLTISINSHFISSSWQNSYHSEWERMSRHLYHVFTYNYFLLIEKDICDHQSVSFKLPCVCVCLWSGDFPTFLYAISQTYERFLLEFKYLENSWHFLGKRRRVVNYFWSFSLLVVH